MKHKTITLILSALLDIEDFRFTFSFKHMYIAICLFLNFLILFSFFFIHMCIQCLGHFSPFLLPPLLPPPYP
jgi:hypothetical protein